MGIPFEFIPHLCSSNKDGIQIDWRPLVGTDADYIGRRLEINKDQMKSAPIVCHLERGGYFYKTVGTSFQRLFLPDACAYRWDFLSVVDRAIYTCNATPVQVVLHTWSWPLNGWSTPTVGIGKEFSRPVNSYNNTSTQNGVIPFGSIKTRLYYVLLCLSIHPSILLLKIFIEIENV